MQDSLFETEYGTNESDREKIVGYVRDYLRTGIVVDELTLRSGSFRLDGPREPLSQCAWKWSEVTGKYVGCPFWSVRAAVVFAELAAANPDKSTRWLCRTAQRAERGSDQLQHEHVFPRKDWVQMLETRIGCFDADAAVIRDLLERYCIGCVVTKAEHRALGARGHPSNPWVRYRAAGVRIVRNERWPSVHRAWIDALGLSDPPGTTGTVA